MSHPSTRLVRTLALAAMFVAAPTAASFAQGDDAAPIAPATTVATVDGHAITEADLSFAAEDMAQDLARMPPEHHRAFLLRVMIDMKVLSGAARDAGMDKTEIFAQRRQHLEERALRRAYYSEAVESTVTDEAVRAEYDKYVAAFTPQDEIRASHILVEDEQKARDLRAEAEGGSDFAALARENSIDPGAANGGDLGFFSKGMMVPEFEGAAFALGEPGAISEPVKSQFGWHVIKLEEKRLSTPAAYEQVAAQIRQQLLVTTFTEKVEELMEGTEIDIVDPELAALLGSANAAEEAAPAE